MLQLKEAERDEFAAAIADGKMSALRVKRMYSRRGLLVEFLQCDSTDEEVVEVFDLVHTGASAEGGPISQNTIHVAEAVPDVRVQVKAGITWEEAIDGLEACLDAVDGFFDDEE